MKIIILFFCFFITSNTYATNFIDQQLDRLQKHKDELIKKKDFFNQIISIPCHSIKLNLDDCSPYIPFIQKKLFLKGFLKEPLPNNNYVYNHKLQRGIQSFQKSHFFKDDGVFGKKTCLQLNISPSEEIKKIEQAIFKLQTLKQKINHLPKAIIVNVPHFKVHTLEYGMQQFEMRAIVGKYKMQTPIRSEILSKIIINPNWVIPPTILKNKLKEFSKDPQLVSDKNITITNQNGNEVILEELDWEEVKKNQHSYRFEQSPGEKNVLGRLKFILENGDFIYLHGTNLPELFQKSSRDLSSGCVRLEQPNRLAQWILEDFGKTSCHNNKDLSEEELNTCLNRMLNTKIDTKKNIYPKIKEKHTCFS